MLYCHASPVEEGDKAVAAIEASKKEGTENNAASLKWDQGVQAQYLLKEAEALLHGKAPDSMK